MTHQFKLPMGDFSNDGHGQVEWFWIKSDLPVQEAREAYFSMAEQYGTAFDRSNVAKDGPGGPCVEYEDSTMSPAWIEAMKLSDKDFAIMGWHDSFDKDENGNIYCATDDLIVILLFCLNRQNPKLNLKIIPDPHDMFQCYGMDSKQRHIGQIGYGCLGN